MNLLDIIFTISLGFLLVRGLFRGLILEAASLGGLALGFFAANAHSPKAEGLARQVITDERFVPVAAYVLVFVLTLLVAYLVAHLLRRVVKTSALSYVDHGLGGATGLAKGALVSAIILIVLTVTMPGSALLTASVLRPYVTWVADPLAEYLPSWLQMSYRAGRGDLPEGSPLQQ